MCAIEVDVLDAKLEAFGEAESGAIEQAGNELRRAVERGQQPAHLVAREHDRQAGRRAGADDAGQVSEGAMEDGIIEEQERAEGLVLGRGGDRAANGERGQEGGDRGLAEEVGMLLVVEDDEPTDPVGVGFFGAGAEVAEAAGLPDAVHESRWRR